MSDDDTQVLPIVAGNGNGHGAPTTVLDALRAQRAKQTAGRTLDLDVPGYGGLLVMRLGPLPGQTFTRLRERQERSRAPEREFHMSADILVAACVAVLGRTSVEDDLIELHEQGEDEPVRLDERLADLLGFEARTARDVVRSLFGGAPSPELAAGVAAGRYTEWAAAMADEADEAFLGEA